MPLHVTIQPDRERASGLERGVVVFPVGGTVLGGSRLRHGRGSLQTGGISATAPFWTPWKMGGLPIDIWLVNQLQSNDQTGKRLFQGPNPSWRDL